MTELAKALSKLICVIKVKAGEDGKMFGSVTAGMIADELKHQFDISLDKRKIHLEHPIRALGDHEMELNLHAEVKGTLKVRVESTHAGGRARSGSGGRDCARRSQGRGRQKAQDGKTRFRQTGCQGRKSGQTRKG